jgi:hypothetical protein
VDALGRIARYEGNLQGPGAIDVLLAIWGGDYDASIRNAASSILQGDLKAYIFTQEE